MAKFSAGRVSRPRGINVGDSSRGRVWRPRATFAQRRVNRLPVGGSVSNDPMGQINARTAGRPGKNSNRL